MVVAVMTLTLPISFQHHCNRVTPCMGVTTCSVSVVTSQTVVSVDVCYLYSTHDMISYRRGRPLLLRSPTIYCILLQ